MKTIIFSLFLLITINAVGQRFLISNSLQKVLYCDLPINSLDILVKGYAYDSLIISTNNGVIVKPDYSYKGVYAHCYYIKELKAGTALITIKAVKNNTVKLVGQANFAVKYYPEVKFAIGSGSAEMNKKEFAEQKFVRVSYMGTDMDKNLNIDSFSYVVFHDKKPIFSKTLYSNEIDSETSEVFSKLTNGDRVLFFDIWANDLLPARKLEDLLITIKE